MNTVKCTNSIYFTLYTVSSKSRYYVALKQWDGFAPECGEQYSKSHICFTSHFLSFLGSKLHMICVISPLLRPDHSIQVLIYVGWCCFPSDKTTLGCNDLEVDRWAAWSDLSAQAWTILVPVWPSVCCPAEAGWYGTQPGTSVLAADQP